MHYPSFLLVIISILSFIGCKAQHEDYVTMDNGAFTDNRDGQEYDWVKIGYQIWMAGTCPATVNGRN